MAKANAAKPRHAQRPLGFYETPSGLLEDTREQIPFLPAPTLDPFAGRGRLIAGTTARGIELSPDVIAAAAASARLEVGDGLAVDWSGENIIGNPPFYLLDRVLAKIGEDNPASALILMRIGVLAGAKRAPLWRQAPPRALFFLSSRPSFTGDGRTDSADYVWALWWPAAPPLLPRIGWILKRRAWR